MSHQTLAILDFGSQYTQLIARRVRELQVYCEIFPWDVEQKKIEAMKPQGYILSGGPTSVYEPGAPTIPCFVLESGLPILGICYGMQALTQALGGKVASSQEKEYGLAQIDVVVDNLLLDNDQQVWMSHGDRIETPPPGFVVLARSSNSPTAAMGDLAKHRYGVQFHPEVHHTPGGKDILHRFAVDICGIKPDWTAESIIQESVAAIREQVGDARVLTAVSGGVDSSVATALAHRAIGSQLTAVFVDNGLLRKGERQQVEDAFGGSLGGNLIVVDAVDNFLGKLQGVTDPEQKRKIIGETFIRVFEAEANRLGDIPFLAQGTIYPDVVESASSGKAHTIKSHHNVGGLPEDIQFSLVEPLRYLFKDEVRAVGEALGLPASLVWRQPFPGPGLAVRCLGEITPERLSWLRQADHIFTSELVKAGYLHNRGADAPTQVAQGFAALLNVRSVGVMGDQRTYQQTIVLRAVTTEDFMTADWARLPADLLGHVANRIVNEVQGVNRVVYDITSKPPGTIEWE